MKWWAIPFLLVGPPLFLYGMAADRDGLIFDLSFVAGGILTLMGALLLIFFRTPAPATSNVERGSKIA